MLNRTNLEPGKALALTASLNAIESISVQCQAWLRGEEIGSFSLLLAEMADHISAAENLWQQAINRSQLEQES